MAKERVHGPYKHRSRWRVVHVHADGKQEAVSFSDEQGARRYAKRKRAALHCRAVGDAVTEYLAHLRTSPGRGGYVRRESTIRLEEWRLSAFLKPLLDSSLTALTSAAAAKLLETRRGAVKPDTLAGELVTAMRWARWCRSRGWLRGAPFDGLVVAGERTAGKPQLRVDSARRFLSAALHEQSASGLAAAMALLMGMRASEITGLHVRDIDDGGKLVWISRAKTRRGVRRLSVPPQLVSRLGPLAAGRSADEPLWGDVDRHWLGYHVVRLCRVAGVERVTPHGLRGTWATLSVAAMPTEQVAATLGHLPAVSRAAYIAPGAEQSAAATRVAEQLAERVTTADDVVTQEAQCDSDPSEESLN